METIRSSREISNLFKHGKSFSNRYVSFLISKRRNEKSGSSIDHEEHGLQGRVAFIAGKKNGNAVWRNSAKRRLREVCRAAGGPWSGYDVVFIAKPQLLKESYSKVLQECEKTLKRSLIFNEGEANG